MKKQRWKILCGSLFVLPVISFSACYRSEPVKSVASETPIKQSVVITDAEVNAAQQAWCDGLVKVGNAYKEGGTADLATRMTFSSPRTR